MRERERVVGEMVLSCKNKGRRKKQEQRKKNREKRIKGDELSGSAKRR